MGRFVTSPIMLTTSQLVQICKYDLRGVQLNPSLTMVFKKCLSLTHSPDRESGWEKNWWIYVQRIPKFSYAKLFLGIIKLASIVYSLCETYVTRLMTSWSALTSLQWPPKCVLHNSYTFRRSSTNTLLSIELNFKITFSGF